ncbi:hydrogen gas-evolving membrane-bound hydrogenase subunit E [Natranaerofaba carboxydovora]|uniref:hydrogen gas-evolving membrane-bound hydrogenase subunit E n=1 Tax=Natranaerofaba carboxydovora TaxID=2742683 RepID=UPI001F12E113|nr:hydrogen gas-evolving membrane-bound hydrogenase subunit E [Natranaerofaba carboxydovora]UMZ72856.1 hypothetical protein ACONDI_00393 [Natranaerofaba carboxydovora]
MLKNLIALIAIFLIGYSMLLAVAEMPTFGDPDNPTQNEVAQRYLEEGPEETQHPNLVSAVLVAYRSFDTFGEITVLFTSVTGVLAVIHGKRGDE